jgi:hypothetical protein
MADEELDPETKQAQKDLADHFGRVNRREYFNRLMRQHTAELVRRVLRCPLGNLPPSLREIRILLEKTEAEATKEGV